MTHTGRRIASRQITTGFSLRFCYDLVISSQSYQNMKKLNGYLLSESCFKNERGYLDVKKKVIQDSLILIKSKSRLYKRTCIVTPRYSISILKYDLERKYPYHFSSFF